MKITLALRCLFPGSRPGVDYLVTSIDGDESISSWNLPQPRPTIEELQLVDTSAAEAVSAQIEVLRIGLRAEYAALSLGERWRYQNAFEGVRAMLNAGDIAEARKIIELSSTPTEELAAAKARMLALFP